MCVSPGKTLESERLARDNPETNPITIKFEPVNHGQRSAAFPHTAALHQGGPSHAVCGFVSMGVVWAAISEALRGVPFLPCIDMPIEHFSAIKRMKN